MRHGTVSQTPLAHERSNLQVLSQHTTACRPGMSLRALLVGSGGVPGLPAKAPEEACHATTLGIDSAQQAGASSSLQELAGRILVLHGLLDGL